ncbi:hypothetical protein [Haloferula sp. BvORR071]|uniref:hypothetical protein n=1 Tax=Haloferula sp. BvORR071 TaxID=1396141 RepID=UPI000551EC53|nr:hypothetical protein [Haloferula sp. BvORR071]
MNRKVPLLLLSHACVFAVVYGAARYKSDPASSQHREWESGSLPAKTNSRTQTMDGGKGQRFLKDFLASRTKSEPDADSRYLELKASLPVAKDVKAAAVEEIQKEARPFSVMRTKEQEAKALARLEVRMLHWMRQDPGGAMDFVLKDESSQNVAVVFDLRQHVCKDLIAERGLAACLPWLIKTPVTAGSFCDGLVAEMKSGGGVAALEKLHSAMMAVPEQASYFTQAAESRNPWTGIGRTPFLRAAEALPFSERESLVEMANRQEKELDQIELLRGFARSSPEAAVWLLERTRNGDLKGTVAERTRQEALTAVQKGSGADLALRVGAMAEAPGRTSSTRGDLETELLAEDISGVLKEGRDWRYEFRHGAASSDEVLVAMRAALPATAKAGDAPFRKALFRQLVEENPVQARALIEGLPAEEKRAFQYDVLQRGFSRVSPELFKVYLSALPAATTPQEKEQRAEALQIKASAYAERFGDNYQQTVKSMAAGADRDAAVSGIVRQAKKKNPAQATKVEQELSPKDP